MRKTISLIMLLVVSAFLFAACSADYSSHSSDYSPRTYGSDLQDDIKFYNDLKNNWNKSVDQWENNGY